jgi:hippurate hydrolase
LAATPALTAADLAGIYRDLHAHPELAFTELRTAGIVAGHLRSLGYETVTGVGGTGVVGLLRNGAGPAALLRADLDALPVLEQTGLEYASAALGVDSGGREVPVMHACGHDVHVTCLLGAAAALAADLASWQGTLMLVFQPAEEVGGGAQAMVDDGLFDRFGRPDVVLGQHVSPAPAGILALRPGPAFAAADSLRVVLRGRGGHASRPETSVDPVLMAAATVLRLQGIVSREIGAGDTAVVTVGSIHAGSRENIIPSEAELLLSIRTFDPAVREQVIAAVERIVAAEAAASGAPAPPLVEILESFPAVVNDPDACARTKPYLETAVGPGLVFDPGPVTGSEDVGVLATAAEVAQIVRGLPSNHSPLFAPVIEPTLSTGVAALAAAARGWLPAEPV